MKPVKRSAAKSPAGSPDANPDETPRRGRPRAYDPDAALVAATGTFWRSGFSGTSFDELGAAAGMNRPSLYAAFGDKRQLYLQSLARYVAFSSTAMQTALGDGKPLAEAMTDLFEGAIAIYRPKQGEGRGCLLVGTATTEAATDADVRKLLAEGVHALDAPFEMRFRRAVDDGELDAGVDVREHARLASAVLHSLGIRARAGESRASLRAMARAAVSLLCQPRASATRQRRGPRTSG